MSQQILSDIQGKSSAAQRWDYTGIKKVIGTTEGSELPGVF
jgi:hypothetical protein